MNRPNWRFYGRKKEMDIFRMSMGGKKFTTIAIIGGRRVGKTELIQKVTDEKRDVKHIYLEVPKPASKKETDGISALRQLNRDLALELESNRLTGFPNPGTLKDNVVDHIFHFTQILETLFRKGVTVTLDEFQNIQDLSLEWKMKSLIDRLGGLGPKHSEDGGVLIIAGSNQQRMVEMLYRQDQPLYDRPDTTIRLRPMRTSELLEMAAQQGWLDRPYRFLTAYTVLGGMPGRWERFAKELNDGTLPEPADGTDEAWSRMFMEHEFQRILDQPEESFFNTAYVNLADETYRLARELTRNPRGVRWNQLVRQFGDSPSEMNPSGARKSFNILHKHLAIAEPVTGLNYMNDPTGKVRICDQAVLFELRMLRHVEQTGSAKKPPTGLLQDMEGLAFERFCAQWLERCRLYETVSHSVEMTTDDDRSVEIDVVAESGDPEVMDIPRNIGLCSCKRASGRHNPGETHRDFDLYLKMRELQGETWPQANTRRLLLSPDWPDTDHPDDGFQRLGLADMAETMGLTVEPWPEPIKKGHDSVGFDY